MGKHTAHSLMEIRLWPESPHLDELYSDADLTREGIDASVSGIVGPLQYEADEVGKHDVLDAVLDGVDLSGLYTEAAALLPSGWADRTVSVYALVRVVWTTDDTPEGHFIDCDLQLGSLLHQNDLQSALLAMLPKDGPK